LEKDAGTSLQIFLSERFLIVIKLFLFSNDESVVSRFLLRLYKKFTIDLKMSFRRNSVNSVCLFKSEFYKKLIFKSTYSQTKAKQPQKPIFEYSPLWRLFTYTFSS